MIERGVPIADFLGLIGQRQYAQRAGCGDHYVQVGVGQHRRQGIHSVGVMVLP